MKELNELIKYLNNNGLEHHKINIDILCGIIEYFANKSEPKQCDIPVVSQRSELLVDFMQHLSEYYNIDEVIDCTKHKHIIDQYIKSNNSC